MTSSMKSKSSFWFAVLTFENQVCKTRRPAPWTWRKTRHGRPFYLLVPEDFSEVTNIHIVIIILPKESTKLCYVLVTASRYLWMTVMTALPRQYCRRRTSSSMSFDGRGKNISVILKAATNSLWAMVEWRSRGEKLYVLVLVLVLVLTIIVYRQICSAKYSVVKSFKHSSHLVLTGCTRMPGKNSKYCWEHEVVICGLYVDISNIANI